jgi:TolA-binding protein
MRLDIDDLETLVQAVAQEMGDGCEEQRLRRHKQKLLALLSAPRRAHWRGLSASFAAVTAVGAALICLWVFLPHGGSLSFEVGLNKAIGMEGQWLESTPTQSLPILFADHSTLSLEGQTRAQVVASTKRNVEILLEEGNLRADVVSTGARRWMVRAGPYEIRDIGTRFQVEWQRSLTELEVNVWEGRVQVNGPYLGEAGVVVSASEKFQIDRYGKTTFSNIYSHVESSSESDSDDTPEAAADDTPEVAADDASEMVSDTESDKQALPGTAPPTIKQRSHSVSNGNGKKRIHHTYRATNDKTRSTTIPESYSSWNRSSYSPAYKTSSLGSRMQSLPEDWQALLDQGRYNDLMMLVKKSGLEHWLLVLDLPELWRLAEAARYAKQDQEANQILLAVRKRFPATWHARVAAYLLGRLAMQQSQNSKIALKWFTTYLNEDPDGSLAEEALGRLISVYQTLGQNQEAQEAAKTYLQRYPNGMFTFLARSVIK